MNDGYNPFLQQMLMIGLTELSQQAAFYYVVCYTILCYAMIGDDICLPVVPTADEEEEEEGDEEERTVAASSALAMLTLAF